MLLHDFYVQDSCLIEQYSETVEERPFAEQLNYTLTLNCLLGLIVMPKERVVTKLPSVRMTSELKTQMGLNLSVLPCSEMTLKNLIIKMRHSVAHFSIETRSLSEENLIDEIVFIDTEHGRETYDVFRASELLPFLKYYANCLLINLRRRAERRLAISLVA